MISNDLLNRIVSIQVIEPHDWKHGIVIGRVSEVFENGLRLRLTKSTRSNKFRSTSLLVNARYQGEDISTLISKRKLMVGGTLIKESTCEEDYIFTGELSI